MSFVKSSGGQFTLDQARFRFIGVNHYGLVIQSSTQSYLKSFFAACKPLGINVVRTWCFDSGSPPSNSAGNFRYLTYPLGTNLISNGSFETNITGWDLGADFTRSNDTAEDGSYAIKQVSTGSFLNYQTGAAGIAVAQNTDYVLTYWYKETNSGGNDPVIHINTAYVEENGIVLLSDYAATPSSDWTQKQLLFNSGSNSTLWIKIFNNGGTINAYYDAFNLSVQATPVLTNREATYQQLDLVLDQARQVGVRLILSLMDSNEFNYNTKLKYVQWANSIYGSGLSTSFPYADFFTNSHCIQMYKDFCNTLATRVNTINGLTYKNDDTIFAWELGNEIRLNLNDASGQNTINGSNLAILSKSGGWADIMSTYIKSIDANHMVSFGDMSHTWQWYSGDTVSNGTYYGVDYNILSALPNIDYADYHTYPDQNDNIHLLEYGQRLGYPDAISGDGYRAQLRDFVNVPKANGKPAIIGETGFIRDTIADNTYYPLYPRHNAFNDIFETFFDAGGDGVVLWHGEIADSASYTINLGNWDGTTTNLNYNDTTLKGIIVEELREMLPQTEVSSANPPSSPFVPTLRDEFIPSFTVENNRAKIDVVISGTDAQVSNPGITFNQAGVTFNDSRYTFGGVYNQDQDIVPVLEIVYLEIPHMTFINDIYTAGETESGGQLMGILGLTYPTGGVLF